MANVDFEFDFETALAKAYQDDEIYQNIAYIAKDLDMKGISTEDAIRELIKINSSVLAKVLKKYNYELLNEL
ncbi:MAG: hypothetical protein K2G55_05665 [Lachnospiraceae bacterium]|nr:hypothetical protein [Lachnospiraceae bacterium]MDE7202603.1 hypothetical protein [Lachnospiraceae bacterium]